MKAECPLLALSGHRFLHRTCPLLGVKRTCLVALHMSAFDPKRTLAFVIPAPFRALAVIANITYRSLGGDK